VAFVDCVNEIDQLGREGRLPGFAAVGVGKVKIEAEMADSLEEGYVFTWERRGERFAVVLDAVVFCG
jgi:hypothetical protein